MRLDLLTNATVVDDAIRFVLGKFKDRSKLLSNSNEEDDEESYESAYNEDGKDRQEEQEGETEVITTNQVF